MGQIIVNNFRVLECRGFVPFGRFKCTSRLESQAKPVREALQNKGDCLLIWVPSQVQRELCHIQGRNHRHWMENGTP